jgi:two-component system, response regulator PdtaR
MRSIIIAFPDMAIAQKIRDILLRSDFPVRGIATNASMALRFILSEDGGGLIICGAQFSDMTSIQLQSLLPDDYDMLMITAAVNVNSAFGQKEGLYSLALPLHAQDLVSSVRMLLDTRQMYKDISRSAAPKTNAAKDDPAPPKRDTEAQRTIDQAKALLMNRNNMSEQEAHRFLQKKSMDNGLKLIDMAVKVLRSVEN